MSIAAAHSSPAVVAAKDTSDVAEFVAIRHRLHSEPELAYEEKNTSALVAELLTGWGYEVATGIGGTGVVGTLRRGPGHGPSVSAPIWTRCPSLRRRASPMPARRRE